MHLAGLLTLILAATGAEVPAALRALEARGNVTIVEYDPVAEPREYPGLTEYHIELNRRYASRYRVERAAGGGRTLVVQLTMSDVEVRLTHRMLLPRGWDARRRFDRELVFHEFDHVAVSADPRARRLLEHLLRRPLTVERRLEPGGPELSERIEQIHRDDLDRAFQAVSGLIHYNYRRLDALTDHGARPVPDRAAFFEGLYSRENLRAAGFAPLDEVVDLLGDPSYRRMPAPDQEDAPAEEAGAAPAPSTRRR